MADTTLTGRLKRLFSGSTIVRNIGGRKLKVIEKIFFNPNQKFLFDFIALPLLNVDKEIKEKENNNNNNFDDVEMILKEYNDIEKKFRKTDLEKKLLEFFRDKLNKN